MRPTFRNTTPPARSRGAFTLVEILIVVIILGILAAIVVPQFATATNDARVGNLEAQISQLNNQIELYAAQKGGYPATMTDWTILTGASAGTTSYYLKDPPRNPAWPTTSTATSISTVTTATDRGSATTAWVWNSNTRQFYASYFNEDATPPVISTVATD
jgi:general secretion pathway protein G